MLFLYAIVVFETDTNPLAVNNIFASFLKRKNSPRHEACTKIPQKQLYLPDRESITNLGSVNQNMNLARLARYSTHKHSWSELLTVISSEVLPRVEMLKHRVAVQLFEW